MIFFCLTSLVVLLDVDAPSRDNNDAYCLKPRQRCLALVDAVYKAVLRIVVYSPEGLAIVCFLLNIHVF